MPIFLVGFMGCGKTEIGQILAKMLGLPFFDTDKIIEEDQQKKISDLFLEKGEAYFREQEYNLIRSYPFPSKSVVSTGGGLPCFGSNMEYLLSIGDVVYLDACSSLLEMFLISPLSKNKRPLLKDCNSAEEIKERINILMQERLPFYEKAKYRLTVVKKRSEQKVLIAELVKIWQ